MSLKICITCRERQAGRKSIRCSKCSMKQWRQDHPLEARFAWVKQCAIKRQIPFKLTIEQFSAFCDETGYLTSVGVNGMSIDRIDPDKGYEVGNIRILPYQENCRLGAIHQHSNRRSGHVR